MSRCQGILSRKQDGASDNAESFGDIAVPRGDIAQSPQVYTPHRCLRNLSHFDPETRLTAQNQMGCDVSLFSANLSVFRRTTWTGEFHSGAADISSQKSVVSCT